MIKKRIMKLFTLIVISGVLTSTLNTVKANAAWEKNSTGWWYTSGNSFYVGWNSIQKSWYYFDSNGYMKTGWFLDGSTWYYLKLNGVMATGTIAINGKPYKFNNNGEWLGSSAASSYSNGVKTNNDFGDQVADANCDEGHSITEVVNKWNTLKPTFSGNNIFDDQPNTKAPYKTGRINSEYLNDTLNYLNFARYLTDIEPVKLDSDLNIQAQYGAVLTNANAQLEHINPIHPSDMSDEFYELGQKSTSSSNLATGKLFESIQGCLNDDYNLRGYDNIGHREWLLDPKVTKIGFGTTSNYSVQNLPFYDFDKSVDNPDYLAWPSQGAFPNTLINRNAVWSINLNKDIYDIDDDIKVKITRLCDNKQWNLNKVDSLSKETTGFKVLSDNGYGFGADSNTIIFHIGSSDLPVGKYLGKYKVEILGLNKNVEYTINFFNLD